MDIRFVKVSFNNNILNFRIERLGGEIDDSPQWNMNCTHVIAHRYENFNAKVHCKAVKPTYILSVGLTDI